MQEAGLAVAVPVAGADHAGLHEGAAAHHADAVHVVVAEVEVPLRTEGSGALPKTSETVPDPQQHVLAAGYTNKLALHS